MTTETFNPPESVGGLQRVGMGAALVGAMGAKQEDGKYGDDRAESRLGHLSLFLG